MDDAGAHPAALRGVDLGDDEGPATIAARADQYTFAFEVKAGR